MRPCGRHGVREAEVGAGQACPRFLNETRCERARLAQWLSDKESEIQVQSLVLDDPLEKEMATHSSTLAWRIPRTEEPGGLQSMGLQRPGHDLATNTAI